jgi:hypothetical protein
MHSLEISVLECRDHLALVSDLKCMKKGDPKRQPGEQESLKKSKAYGRTARRMGREIKK